MIYRTRQQQAVLRCLARRPDDALTATELAEELHRDGESVGMATIYRQLERLEQNQQVHKISTANGARYQFCPDSGEDCILLRCTGCGRVWHLDCPRLQAFYKHMEEVHHFRIDSHRTVLTGLCQDCQQKEAAQHGL